MSASSTTALEVRGLLCERGSLVLQARHLALAAGVFHLLQGEAGEGRDCLLRVLGLLEEPDDGEVLIEGESVRGLSEDARLRRRERRLGFIFAAPFLLPALSVIENVAMPLFKISDVEAAEARRRSEELLEFAGIPDLAQTPCADLPPLAQHRVSLARALVNEPAALLVENLDGALAGENLHAFSALLRQAAPRFGIAVIAAASAAFAPEPADRVIEVRQGAVVCRDELLPKPDT